MLMQTTLLLATLQIGQPRRDTYVPLSGTVVSGVAGYYKQRAFVGAANVTVYCANGKFDGRFNEWLAVWDEDQTSGSPNYLGGFHFYHPNKLEGAISLIYQSTCGEKSDGTTPAFFSKSFQTTTVERKGQKGNRRKVKARLALRTTDSSFESVDMAFATIVEIVEAHYILRLRTRPRNHDGKVERPEGAVDAERAACAAIEREIRLVFALLAKDKKIAGADDVRLRLVKFLEEPNVEERVSNDLADLFRRCVLNNTALWEKGPDPKLLEQETERWRSYRQRHPGG